MYRYLLEQEKLLQEALEKDGNTKEALGEAFAYAKVQIEWICHERLVHLLVTLFFGMTLLSAFVGLFLLQTPAMGVLFAILTILDVFYIVHYFKMENGTQRLYGLANEIYAKMREGNDN